MQSSGARPFRLFTTDLLLVDRVCPITYTNERGDEVTNTRLKSLVERYRAEGKLNEGGKMPISKEVGDRDFKPIFDASPECRNFPGGSASNTAITLKNTLGDAINIGFLGVTGNGEFDSLIKRSFKEAGKGGERSGVNLLPYDVPEGMVPESALSYVIKNGDRTIATVPGNAKKILNADAIKSEYIENSDAVFLQAGLALKLDDTIPKPDNHADDKFLGVVDKMLKLRWKHKKDLWLAMPTQADFSDKKRMTHSQRADYFKKLIASANVILSNGEEIARVYTTEQELNEIDAIRKRLFDQTEGYGYYKLKDLQRQAKLVPNGLSLEEHTKYNLLNRSINFDLALERLQADLAKHPLENIAKNENWSGNTDQLAFVTLGEKGIAVVTPDESKPLKIEALKVSKEKIVNTLGCGDSAYAGILAGVIARKRDKNITPKDIAVLGREVATLKLFHDSARIPDPAAALRKQASPLGKGVFHKVIHAVSFSDPSRFKFNGVGHATPATF